MYDHAPAGFPHRNLDGFDVERNECAQVDNLRIYVQIGYGAGNHMNHGAIAKNGKRLPFPYYPRLAQVDAIIAIRHVGLRIPCPVLRGAVRSEEHTSELQSLMRISYAVFCLKQKTYSHININAD